MNGTFIQETPTRGRSATTSFERRETAVSRSDRSTINAKTLSDLYDAFVTGNTERAVRYVTPDLILHVPGRGWNAGEYWGVEGFRKFMSNIAAYNGGLFDMRVPAFSVTGDDAFTREVLRINRKHDPEREFVLKITNQFKLRDGKLSELWVIPEDQHAYDEYYALSNDAKISAKPKEFHHRQRLLDIEHATSPENAQLLTGMYDEFWRGNKNAMSSLIAGDVVVTITGHSAMSGEYHGWDGYMKFRDKLMAMAGTKYKLDVIALAASERDAWATEYIRMNRRWDESVQAIYVVMHFEIENGKITRMDDFPVNPYVWEQFYTPSSR
jgi:ketosteroid isomerase-like protein